mmetsp:Transcript_35918/g.96305  ORF Transcript_35918/g.96305 Transcript_35918/m.96305 type:complete len:251 (+) Transcript_35918:484-1236(+)
MASAAARPRSLRDERCPSAGRCSRQVRRLRQPRRDPRRDRVPHPHALLEQSGVLIRLFHALLPGVAVHARDAQDLMLALPHCLVPLFQPLLVGDTAGLLVLVASLHHLLQPLRLLPSFQAFILSLPLGCVVHLLEVLPELLALGVARLIPLRQGLLAALVEDREMRLEVLPTCRLQLSSQVDGRLPLVVADGLAVPAPGRELPVALLDSLGPHLLRLDALHLPRPVGVELAGPAPPDVLAVQHRLPGPLH